VTCQTRPWQENVPQKPPKPGSATAAVGSSINFNITGSTGIDVIKANLDPTNTISGGDNADQTLTATDFLL
jgi:hypothetical protein